MKGIDVEEFVKMKQKEHRMKIDKIKEAARQRNQERHENETNREPLEKLHHHSQ